MILGMHGPEIAEQIASLDGLEELVRAPAAVRAVFPRTTTAGR